MKYIVSLAAWTTGIIGMLIWIPAIILASFFFSQRTIPSKAGFFFRLMLVFFFVRVRVTGRERVDADRARLFMANHASFFDLLILGSYLPGYLSGIEASEHFSWPIWGTMIRRLGMIPIDRSSGAASMRSIKKASEKIKDGVSVLILPEGTRTTSGRMLPFARLPFHLAKKSECPITPVGLKGTFKLKNKKSWLLRPGRVEMNFGETISAEEVAEKSSDELKEIVRSRIAVLCGEE